MIDKLRHFLDVWQRWLTIATIYALLWLIVCMLWIAAETIYRGHWFRNG